MTKNIALLEVSTGHVEVLYSQALILTESGFDVHLIVPECNKERLRQFDLKLHTILYPMHHVGIALYS